MMLLLIFIRNFRLQVRTHSHLLRRHFRYVILPPPLTKIVLSWMTCVRSNIGATILHSILCGSVLYFIVQSVPLATEPGISLIILTPMKILQRNLNRSTFVVWEMKRDVSVVHFKFRCNILISGEIIKEIPSLVASGTHYIYCIQRVTLHYNGQVTTICIPCQQHK